MARVDDYPTVNCVECGKQDKASFVDEVLNEMVDRSLCFTCNFWTNWIERDKTDVHSVVINGEHYHIGDENSSRFGFRGFGGRLFTIQFNSGIEVKTTNLWHQGEIPEHFRSRFPDTAKFI